MKKLTTLIFLMLFVNAYSQNNYRVEYFIDNDNGYELNPYIEVNSGDDFVFNKTINLNKTSDGLHTFYVRVKDDKGNWSTTHMSHFVSKTISKGKVTDLEYFIDNDPGIGKAIKIDFEEGKRDFVVTKNINLDNIPQGLHSLFIRAKDEGDNWSCSLINHFICLDPYKWKIDSLEYYIDDNDPGYGQANKVTINSSSKVDINFNVDLTDYEIGMHTISLRAKRYLGTWSRDYIFNFEIKDNLGVAEFGESNLLAYPSPTTGSFYMDLEFQHTNIDLVVTDLKGRVISEKHYEKTDKIAGTLIGNNGIYIVYILSENKVVKIFKIEKM